MNTLRIAFVALLAVSLLLGGVTAADFGNNLNDAEKIGFIKSQLVVEPVDVAVEDDRFVATVRIENPTGLDVELRSAKLRVHTLADQRLASGAGTRLDDNGTSLAAGESLTVTYEIRLSETQREAVAAALERDETLLSVSFGMTHGTADFSFAATNIEVDREEE